MKGFRVLAFSLCFLFLLPGKAGALSRLLHDPAGFYGVPVDAKAVMAATRSDMDSLLGSHPMVKAQKTVSVLANPRFYDDKTADFYLLLFLLLVLGLIRFSDPKYFYNLWHSFVNPGVNAGQLKDKLQHASFSNFLMNVFFTMVGAAYVYYVVRNFTPYRSGNVPASLLIIMLMGGMMLIYLGKYLVIKFSGWAFRVEGITENYLFNVFLINKILSILLLPFIVVMAFSPAGLAQPALFISFVMIFILFINRYMRSWQVFGSFFQYSKFHFFTYLCASELLPLAVLMKLLVRGLLY